MSDAPLTKKTNRPADSDFKQQRLKAWQPILTPAWVIGTFVVIGIAFVPIGAVLLAASDSVVEEKIQYGGAKVDGIKDDIITIGANKILTLTPKADMKGPVYVYYELENFYQNHRRYVKSRTDGQLRAQLGADFDTEKAAEKTFGEPSWAEKVQSSLSTCEPMVLPSDEKFPKPDCTYGEGNCKVLWPCGLIASSFFNDVFIPEGDLVKSVVSSGKCEQRTGKAWCEKGIAWKSDVDTKFKNPAGWGDPKMWKMDNTSIYKWLHQRYPVFNNLTNNSLFTEGVENEHFIVWMRTAGLPTFRKLYAIIGADNGPDKVTLEKGKDVKIQVHSQFDVDSFSGKKRLVMSTVSWLGGKNNFLGIAYIVVGSISLLLAAMFGAKHIISPRKLGDTTYLVWQDKNKN